MTMTKLDEIALNIELVLISIIEGLALVSLAGYATPILHSADWARSLPYILAGLVILLVFWSQAILHAISFIRWPLRMEHMFLYFVAVFLQVIAYSAMTDILAWFFWWSLFSILAFIIYVVDLRIIRHMPRSEFMADVERRHIFEMRYLVPIALAFNLVALSLVYFMPQLLGNHIVYFSLGGLQLLISIGALYDCVRNFHERSDKLVFLFH